MLRCVITFDQMEYKIGYIVHELLDEVHQAMERLQITDVKISWVKYLIQWPHSGPGYYCGINITKKGQWSKNAIKHRSTR